MAVDEVVVSSGVLERWGETAVLVACEQVWAVACHTCGDALGTETPAMHVLDLPNPVAVLHHPRCVPPQTCASTTFLGQVGVSGDLPWLVLNPRLEAVCLQREAASGAWQVRPDGWLANAGLRTRTEMLIDPTQPIQNVRVNSGPGCLVLQTTDAEYTLPSSEQFAAAVRRTGGIAFLVTHELLPTDDLSGEELISAIRAGRVAMGWIDVAGQAQRPRSTALDELAARIAQIAGPPAPPGKHYELVFTPWQRSLHTLVVATTEALSQGRAQHWADEQIPGLMSHRLPWVAGGEGEWRRADGLLLVTYVLRERPDGWQLWREVAMGDVPLDYAAEDMILWANTAAGAPLVWRESADAAPSRRFLAVASST